MMGFVYGYWFGFLDLVWFGFFLRGEGGGVLVYLSGLFFVEVLYPHVC